MSHWITLVTAHGPMNGWLAQPDDRPVGGIVLVHEIYGVNADMRHVAERHAADGYLTVVPALFDSIRPEVELDYAPANRLLGNALAWRLGGETATRLVATAADAIGHAGDVAIVGYGWGAAIALRAARTLSAPCVVHCGMSDPAWIDEETNTPTLVHRGEIDSQYSPGEWYALERAASGPAVYTHLAGPGLHRAGDWLCDAPGNVAEAFERTREFLHENVHRTGD
ncbi:hypothetical protein GQ56_0131680 [Burkholderia paludis]|uniref:dienelactone hydrolase family protein n=1 Tax=Burkholderia paludis TaxID=1506587 RepID=UPI0005BBF860|nr:dienelactone hydrolase family protein [Burkholderia paludis]KFG93424.1 hypothetical protein GQ56_0131680 [Burkholderia paludis]